MAEFINTGRFRRHLRRIRAAYMKRRDTLVAELEHHFPESEFRGVNAGIHFCWAIPGRSGLVKRIERCALQNRIGLYTPRNGGAWVSSPDNSHADLLMMGYAATSEALIAKSIALLAAAVRQGAA